MANAKQCDICGKFYPVPEFEYDYLTDNYLRQLNYVTIHKAEENEASMYFDSCKKCQQDILDYILSRQAERDSKGE